METIIQKNYGDNEVKEIKLNMNKTNIENLIYTWLHDDRFLHYITVNYNGKRKTFYKDNLVIL